VSSNASTLVVGELIEIKYRAARPLLESSYTSEPGERWITAQIVHQDDDAPPMARLADGQLTDIREYMVWRRLPSAGSRDSAGSGS
jgi:hypothetical protein